MAIVAIVRNPRVAHLCEWIAYHLLQGFHLIRIYDHGRPDGHSTNLPEMQTALAPWIDEGRVELALSVSGSTCARLSGQTDRGRLSTTEVFWPQMAYADGFYALRSRVAWVAFLDFDEFIYSDDDPSASLPSQIARFADESTGALTVEMRRFGCSGQIFRPEGLVIENYLSRERDFPLVRYKRPEIRTKMHRQGNFRKTLVNSAAGERPDFETHSWRLFDGWQRVDIPGPALRLNHYFTKSVEEYLDKMMLGAGSGHLIYKNWALFESLMPGTQVDRSLLGQWALVEDHSMHAYVTSVRAELARIGVA